MSFLTIVAWIFAVLSTGFLLLRVLGRLCYSEHEKLLDNLRGYEKQFPVVWPSIIAIICWAWIASGGRW